MTINQFYMTSFFNILTNLKLNIWFATLRYHTFSKKIVIALIGLILFLGFIYLIKNGSIAIGTSANSNTSQSTNDPRVAVLPPKKSQPLNKEYSFPIKNDAGKEISQIKYILELAEIRDEIVVKGQKATAIKGRTFLIINLKIKNELNKKIEVNTRDYVRLSTNNNEWIAPEIYNDPVEIQPISTKFTRIGFPINDNNFNFKMQLGEITGTKDIFDLIFQ